MDSGVEGKRATHTEEDTGGDEGDQPPKMPKTAEAGELKPEFPHTRLAVLRFSSMNLEVLGRILHREPWGVKARVEEVPPGCTSVAVGDIYWTKWGGETVPMISRPILEVVHQWKK